MPRTASLCRGRAFLPGVRLIGAGAAWASGCHELLLCRGRAFLPGGIRTGLDNGLVSQGYT
eukprot:14776415-Alexandrium_andersonii.AAC.1